MALKYRPYTCNDRKAFRRFVVVLAVLLAASNVLGVAALPQADDTHLPRSLIVGGSPASNLEFPFFVWAKNATCGGTLVAKDMVLTAAHCEDEFEDKVLVGAWLATNETNGTAAQWRKIVGEKVVHPLYVDDTNENDFMLFRIEPVTNPGLVPIELNLDPNVPNLGDRFSVVGMGFNSSENTTADRLLKTQVRYVGHDLCQGQWNASDDDALDNETRIVYEASMFCAIGSFTGASGPAKGDSGGPVIDPNTNKLVGIVSWGAANPDNWGTPFYPTVFARVSHVAEWINATIRSFQAPTTSPTRIPTTPPTARPTRFPTNAPVALVEYLGEASFVISSSNLQKTQRKSLSINKYPGAGGCLRSVELTLDSKLLGSGAKLSNQIVIGSKVYKPNTLVAGKRNATLVMSPCLSYTDSGGLIISLNSTKVTLPGSAFQRKYNVKVKLNGQRL